MASFHTGALKTENFGNPEIRLTDSAVLIVSDFRPFLMSQRLLSPTPNLLELLMIKGIFDKMEIRASKGEFLSVRGRLILTMRKVIYSGISNTGQDRNPPYHRISPKGLSYTWTDEFAS